MSEFKYLIFFLVLIFGVPFNYIMAQKYVQYEKFLWFLLIFFTANMVDINFVSMETYRGTSKGFEIGMVDIVVYSMLAIVIGRRDEYPVKIPPGTTLYFLYFFFSFLSIINSDVLVYSFFELWKMVRMYLFFFVVYNMIRKFEEFNDIMLYISYITIFITFVTLKQKYFLGIFQTYGPFPHQNSLVMYMIVFGSLLLAYLLNNDKIKLYYWLLIFGAAGIDIISTLSRGGMALFAFSTSLIFLLSYTNKMSFRKLGITLLFIILASGVLYKASDTILERVATAPKESLDVRIVLAQAAQNMANDKILGVGLNNFGLKINPPYPYGNHIPRKDSYEKGGLVETIYLMIAAETGWHNLFIFILLLLYFYIKNIRNYFRMNGSAYRYIPLALVGALTAIYIQSTLEWVLKQTNNFYQLIFIFAIIGVVSRLLDNEETKRIQDENRTI